MGPAARRQPPVPFRVRLDGEPPGARHGIDVDADGAGTRRPAADVPADPPARRRSATALFEIEFLDPGAEALVFTFG